MCAIACWAAPSLEVQLEAAAGRRSEGLLGVVAEAVSPHPATGLGEWEGAATRYGRVGLMTGQQT